MNFILFFYFTEPKISIRRFNEEDKYSSVVRQQLYLRKIIILIIDFDTFKFSQEGNKLDELEVTINEI